jgi:hypothetical protein
MLLVLAACPAPSLSICVLCTVTCNLGLSNEEPQLTSAATMREHHLPDKTKRVYLAFTIWCTHLFSVPSPVVAMTAYEGSFVTR